VPSCRSDHVASPGGVGRSDLARGGVPRGAGQTNPACRVPELDVGLDSRGREQDGSRERGFGTLKSRAWAKARTSTAIIVAGRASELAGAGLGGHGVWRWPSWSSIASNRVPNCSLRAHDHPRSGQVSDCTADHWTAAVDADGNTPARRRDRRRQPSERVFGPLTTAAGSPRGDRPARGLGPHPAPLRSTGERGEDVVVSSRRAGRLPTRGVGTTRTRASGRTGGPDRVYVAGL
jgi:hypothetical protein